MTFDEWYDKVWSFKSMDPEDSASAAWNAAMDAAAAFMEARGVSASEFYAREIRAMKAPHR